MKSQSMDTMKIKKYFEMYSESIYRLCFSYMKEESDAEDALQETFLKLIRQPDIFESDEHVKAWLIVTATNHCKSQLKHWWRQNEDIDASTQAQAPNYEHSDVMDAVLDLPEKYKTVVYLYYYEGYKSREIAKILKKPAGTIRSLLHDAKALLEKNLDNPYAKGDSYDTEKRNA